MLCLRETSRSAQRKTNCSWRSRGPSAPTRIVRHSSANRLWTPCTKNPLTKWIEQKTHKNLRRTQRTVRLSGSSQAVRLLADRPPCTCGLSARRVFCSSSPTLQRSNLPPPFAWSPKSTKGLLPNHRRGWSVSRRWYSYELVASNPLNWEESRFYWDQQKS
jgi:hypothetical protein